MSKQQCAYFAVGVFFSSVVAICFYIVIQVPISEEVEQVLVLIMGMLTMAVLNAFMEGIAPEQKKPVEKDSIFNDAEFLQQFLQKSEGKSQKETDEKRTI